MAILPFFQVEDFPLPHTHVKQWFVASCAMYLNESTTIIPIAATTNTSKVKTIYTFMHTTNKHKHSMKILKLGTLKNIIIMKSSLLRLLTFFLNSFYLFIFFMNKEKVSYLLRREIKRDKEILCCYESNFNLWIKVNPQNKSTQRNVI